MPATGCDGFSLYVSTTGQDTFSGRLPRVNRDKSDGPLATPAGAQKRLRGLKERTLLPGPVTVYLRGGTYRLLKPLLFTPADSWPVTFKAYPGEEVILSGGIEIAGWRAGTVNGQTAWVTQVPSELMGLRSLFVNGRRAVRPRLPKKGTFWTEATPEAYNEFSTWCGPISRAWVARPQDMRSYRNIQDVDAVFLHLWVDDRLPLESFDPQTRLAKARLLPTHPLSADFSESRGAYYLDNVFEALSEPGEFYLDRPTHTLYYLPRNGEVMGKTQVIAPRLKQLIQFTGKPDDGQFVEHIRLESLTLAHADWDQRSMPGKSPETMDQVVWCGSGQAASNVPGAVEMAGARACTIENCCIEHAGYYGIEIKDGCSGIRIVGNELYDLGGGGVKVDGSDAAGPLSRRTHNIRITDNHIHVCGRSYAAAVGVLVMHASHTIISHNHIHDLYYSGISAGWVWGGGESVCKCNLIEKNHIHNLGQGWLSDMGGIYTLGQQPGTIIRGNLIHDITKVYYGAWCIYPDEGSAYMAIENNVCYDTNAEIFHQHYGRENMVRNNIFAFGGQFITQLGRKDSPSGERAFTFCRNIFLTDGKPIFSTGGRCRLEETPFDSDCNLLWDIQGKGQMQAGACQNAKKTFRWTAWQALGQDRHSIVADPRFRDLARRDFTLLPDSPALKLGFKPIDISDVGPRPRGRRE